MNEVRDNPELDRYEIRVDGELIGFADYEMRDGRMIVVHTEIHDAKQHRGLGGELVAALLDDVRVRGLKILPVCPFVQQNLTEHPEFDDLVDYEAFEAFNRSHQDQQG